MHKLVQRRICLFLFIAASLFTSCSFFDNSLENNFSASVSFQINGIKSRSATDTKNEVSFLEVMLKGDYEALQTVKIENGKASISFLNIPLGIQVWAEASIYVISGEEKQILYKGKSATVTITAGDNALIIPMKQNTAETPEPDSPENTGGTSNPNGPANPNGSTDSNGTSEPQEPEIIYVDIYATARTLGADELCDGSEDAPFATIAAALSYITSLDNSEENYKIIASGSFSENLIIQNIPAAHLMIEGDGGEVESKITGDGVAGYPLESYQDICLKNITVMANGNLGANIHAGTLTLDGNSKIKCTAAETGGSYGVVVYGNIIMNGNSEISGFLQSSGNTIKVYENAKITMNDDSKIYNCKAGTDNYSGGGGVYLESASLEMNDNAKIYSCQSSYGGGVYLGTKSGSTIKPSLVMNDDSIIENCTGKIGGGVYVGSGTFTMNNNAVISNCTGSMISGVNNKYSAGGVHVDEASIFTMNNNSKITECTGHSAAAGGVWVQGTFYMNGGEISSNTTPYNSMAGAQNGVGGIYLNGTSDSSKATFIMKGGKICDNNGNKYGAVSMSGYCVFDMQGGEISGNLASAVNSDKVLGVMIGWTQTLTNNEYHSGIFKMSGDAVVASDNDVRVSDHTVLTIAGALTGTSSVAKLSFDTYQSETAVISVADGAETTIEAVVEKFTIKAKTVDSVTTNYMLDGGGKLRVKKAAPDAVGDIVFNDGTAVGYDSELVFSTEQKSKAVAVLFYSGAENDELGARRLGVGLKQATGKEWCAGTSVSGFYGNQNTSQTDGKENMAVIKAYSDYSKDNYPAFWWADKYGESNNITVSGSTTGWYLPAKTELKAVYDNKATINASLGKLDDADIFSMQTNYWSSTQADTANKAAFAYYFSSDANGSMWQNPDKDNGHYVCAIREF